MVGGKTVAVVALVVPVATPAGWLFGPLVGWSRTRAGARGV